MHRKKNSSNNRDSSRQLHKMKALLRDLVIIQLIQHAPDRAQLMNARETISSSLKSNKKLQENKIRMVEIIDSKTTKAPNNNNNNSLEE